MTVRLLLDEMFSGEIASQLRARGHDVVAVVSDGEMAGLPDDAVLARASEAGRAVVTRNIRDFAALDERLRAAGSSHRGLILVSAKTFPENRHAIGALVTALDRLLSKGGPARGEVCFLQP